MLMCVCVHTHASMCVCAHTWALVEADTVCRRMVESDSVDFCTHSGLLAVLFIFLEFEVPFPAWEAC